MKRFEKVSCWVGGATLLLSMGWKSLLKKQSFPRFRGNYGNPRRSDKSAARWHNVPSWVGGATPLLMMVFFTSFLAGASCNETSETRANQKPTAINSSLPQNQEEEGYRRDRERMVQLLEFYGIKDIGVMKAMKKIRRHIYVPEEYRWRCDAYGDHPCPIGYGQTISQPYIVAYMTEKMKVKPGEKVLEIGTGSGYQAAVLAELGARVYSIEIVPELAVHAQKVLKKEGYDVRVLSGDGYKGWPEPMPFDVIVVTCAPENVPQKLVEQLKEGGRMILPVGLPYRQRLVILRKIKGKIKKENDLSVMFVPMVHGKD